MKLYKQFSHIDYYEQNPFIEQEKNKKVDSNSLPIG